MDIPALAKGFLRWACPGSLEVGAELAVRASRSCSQWGFAAPLAGPETEQQLSCLEVLLN